MRAIPCTNPCWKSWWLGSGNPKHQGGKGRGFMDRWGAWWKVGGCHTDISLEVKNSIFPAQKSLEITQKMPKNHPRSSVTAEFVVSENKLVSVGLWVMTLFLWIYNYPTYNCFLRPILWTDASKWDTFVAYGSLRSFFSESPRFAFGNKSTFCQQNNLGF